jgi:hypothetical protein
MKISEINLYPDKQIPDGPLVIRVSDPIVDGGSIVEKINYHPANRIFNKGLEVGKAGYVVYLEDIPDRRFIDEAMVSSVVASAEKPKNPEAPMPE